MIPIVLDHLWQSTLVAIAAGLLALAFRKSRAAVRYGLWFAASAKFLVPFSALGMLGRLIAPAMRPPGQARAGAVIVEQAVQPFTPLSAPPAAPAVAAPAAAAHAALFIDPALILLAVWALGAVVVLSIWLARWTKVRAAVREAAPLALAAPMPVLASPWMREPGLVGLFRPVLLVPESLFDHLKPAEIGALVAHEACHLRRRDNLTGAVHMLVEALFWFHPMVWWIGARLIDERERACDEAVVRAGHDPAVYALSLVECSRLYLQSPLTCVAGASGSYLMKRVEMIMTSSPLRPLSRASRAILVAAGACALATPVAAGWLASPGGEEAAARALASIPAELRPAAAPLLAASPAPADEARPAALAQARVLPAVITSEAAPPEAAPVSADRTQPSPGTQDAVQRWISRLQLHQSDEDDMSPAMAAAAAANQDMAMRTISAFGPLRGVRFVRVTPENEDAYEADFAHARIEVLVAPLTADGKVDKLRWRPIWARDGASPQPGVPPAPVASVDVARPQVTLVSQPEPHEGRLPVASAALVNLGASQPPLLTDPVWVRRPTLEAIDRVYPPAADRDRRPGRASMRCHADDRGYLSRCAVLAEWPEGLGFGKAALFLQTEYKLRTLDGTGTPVQGRLVDVTVDFTPRFWAKLAGDGESQVVRWTTDPLGTPYGKARYPWEAMQKGVAAHVTLSCAVQPDGHLSDCGVERESPKGMGFGRMALLSKTQVLQVETRARDGSPMTGRRVEVDYVFNPPCDAMADRDQNPCSAAAGRASR